MLDKDQFAGLIKSQFAMYESVANGIYWQAVRNAKTGWLGLTKANYSAQLAKASNSLLHGIENLADGYVNQFTGEAYANARLFRSGYINSVMAIMETSNKQVMAEIRKGLLKNSIGVVENNPIFAQLNLKRMDSIGRSRSASESIYLTSRHFAILVALQSDYVRFKHENIAFVDIVSKTHVINTVLVDNLMQEDVLKLFHPNSNLRIQAHVTQTQLNG